MNELKEQVVALAAELLKERRKRESNEDYDEDGDDCPFSIDFLDELVSGADSKSLWKKKMVSRPIKAERPRPKTEPQLRPRSSNEESLIADSWENTDPGIKNLFAIPSSRESDRSNERETDEDYNVGKDLVSYDFALRKLRESFEEKNSSDSGSGQSGRVTTPGLGKVKNIEELYDYLNKPNSDELESDADSDNAESDLSDIAESDADSISANVESNKEVNSVVKGHIKKLDETLAHNETLLLQMKKCHKQYEVRLLFFWSSFWFYKVVDC